MLENLLIFVFLLFVLASVACIVKELVTFTQDRGLSDKLVAYRKARMKQSIKIASFADEIKESALLWGIEDNSSNVSAATLLKGTHILRCKVGRETVKRIVIEAEAERKTRRSLRFTMVTTKEVAKRISHSVRRVVSTTQLIQLPSHILININRRGVVGDDEASTI